MWLESEPSCGYGENYPCMHRVWIGVDSGDPVRKLIRYHVVFCAKSSLTCSRAKFSSRVHLGLEAFRMFGTTPRKKFWSNFVQSYFVRTLAYGTWLRSRVNVPCLDLGRFGRSGPKTNTALCVNTAMIVLQRVCPNGLESRLESSKGVTPGQ